MGGELARLASAAGSDPALMALAASSFAEAMIRRELGCPDDKDRGFRELARDLARRPGGEELAEVLTLLSRFRDIANDARHRFSPADPEEGRAAFYLAGELASALDPSGEPPPAWTEAMRGLLAPWRAGEPREEGPALIAARETLGHIDGRALDREIAEWEMLGRELARVETELIAIAPGRTKPADLGRARDEGAEGLRSRRRGLLDSLSGLREAKAAADSLRRMLAPIAARRLFLRREGLATPRHTAEIGRALAEFLADAGGGADPEGAVAPAAGPRPSRAPTAPSSRSRAIAAARRGGSPSSAASWASRRSPSARSIPRRAGSSPSRSRPTGSPRRRATPRPRGAGDIGPSCASSSHRAGSMDSSAAARGRGNRAGRSWSSARNWRRPPSGSSSRGTPTRR